MKVLLHIGAHRTASTSFQDMLWNNRTRLARSGLTAWTPRRTRDGLMAGMLRHPALMTVRDDTRARRSVGRIRVEVDRLRQSGQKFLLVSEENMIGTVVNNLADMRLYPMVAERMSRFAEAFDAGPLRVGLAIRSYEDYWASALAFAVARGQELPDADMLDLLVTQPRRWRMVLRDLARALPGAEICVWSYESLGNRPVAVLERLTDEPAPPRLRVDDTCHNRGASAQELTDILALRGEAWPQDHAPAPGARWMPFNEDQRAVLRAEYRQDLAWLRAGAEGLATFIDGRITPAHDHDRTQESRIAPPDAMPTGGRLNGIEERLG